ncbi:Interleukin-17F [Microtus ochrogaster]|uniref:Interleukin-17F n=1 Tax=Microtus ochrogaster TaxID=79684 RepID=A0A8J6KQD3_MICOH|nr:Interleukin-17F [Microtus ochrogaster]
MYPGRRAQKKVFPEQRGSPLETSMQRTRETAVQAGNCPPLEGKSVRVDFRIFNQNQGVSVSHGFQNRSSSPWDYNITRDPHRFPSEIAEAQCRYSGCINAQGQEDSSMNSVAIQQEILVLRREPQGCPNSFRLEKMRVKVGCTCVTPIVRRAA